jgi:hypothetical protein
MALNNAKASFASAAKRVEFTRNAGSHGAAIYAWNSSIAFNGPALLANNRAEFGSGGAMLLYLSGVTFNATATLRENSVWRCAYMVSGMLDLFTHENIEFQQLQPCTY